MFKSQAFVTVILILVVTGLLAGCASPAAAPAEPTSAPDQLTAPLPSPTVPASQWEQVGKMEASATLRIAAFIDQNTGVIGGPTGTGIARITTDGGKTWTVSEESSGCIFGLEIIDAKTMWECNASDLRVTTDSGKTWSDKIRGRGAPGCKLSAIDDKTAWVVAQSNLMITHDGGLTREPLALPSGLQTSKVAALSFRSQTDGYILDENGKLYVTADGGNTWKDMPSPNLGQYGVLTLRTTTGQPYAAIRFFDTDHGLLVLSLAGGGANKTVSLQTFDGGKSWDEQVIEVSYSTPYLTQDGKYLSMLSAFNSHEVTVFHYTGD